MPKVKCHCGQQYTVKPEMIGKKALCKKCGVHFRCGEAAPVASVVPRPLQRKRVAPPKSKGKEISLVWWGVGLAALVAITTSALIIGGFIFWNTEQQGQTKLDNDTSREVQVAGADQNESVRALNKEKQEKAEIRRLAKSERIYRLGYSGGREKNEEAIKENSENQIVLEVRITEIADELKCIELLGAATDEAVLQFKTQQSLARLYNAALEEVSNQNTHLVGRREQNDRLFQLDFELEQLNGRQKQLLKDKKNNKISEEEGKLLFEETSKLFSDIWSKMSDERRKVELEKQDYERQSKLFQELDKHTEELRQRRLKRNEGN